jgi:hypothetical protein
MLKVQAMDSAFAGMTRYEYGWALERPDY